MGGSEHHMWRYAGGGDRILGRDLEEHIQASSLGRKRSEQYRGVFHRGEEGGVWPTGTGDVWQ